MTLFFALWPDDKTRAGLIERAELVKKQCPTTGRWFDPDRYHLTLHAVDATPQNEAAWLDKAKAAAVQMRTAPFDLRIDQAGSFPNKGQIPWWLGCSQTPEGLQSLWRELRDSLKQHGVPLFTSRLTPHLTLIYSAQRDLPARPVPSLAWTVQDFVLLRSRQGNVSERGSSLAYELIDRWPLNRGPDHAPQRDLWDN